MNYILIHTVVSLGVQRHIRKSYMSFSFRPYYGSGVDSARNRNEYQEYFLVVKAAGM
jgi:hypothetical protein